MGTEGTKGERRREGDDDGGDVGGCFTNERRFCFLASEKGRRNSGPKFSIQ